MPIAHDTLAQLDRRSLEIFRDIVEAYLATGEPVESRTLSKRSALHLSAASMRNTMADLASLGLLDSPHAMAGRRPTERGLRFFVDSLLERGALSDEERRGIESRIVGHARQKDEVLETASELLSGLAGGAGLVLTAAHEAPIKHSEMVWIGPGQALMVLVFEDGHVENRLMGIPLGVTSAQLAEATNFLNTRFRGRTLAEACQEAGAALERERAALDSAAASLVQKGLAEWSGEDPLAGRSLIVRGRANLLADSVAIADLERVRKLFDDLERTRDVIEVLDLAGAGESVRIFIGSENPLFSFSRSSLIVAPYMNADRKVVGALGVIGPTRLNYARVIPVVDFTAQVVSRILDDRAGLLKSEGP